MNKIVLSLMITALSTGATLSAQTGQPTTNTNPGNQSELQKFLDTLPTRADIQKKIDQLTPTTFPAAPIPTPTNPTPTNQLSSRFQELITINSALAGLTGAAGKIDPRTTEVLNRFAVSTMEYIGENLNDDTKPNNFNEVPFVNKLLTTLTNMLTSPAGTNNLNQVLSFTNKIDQEIGSATPGNNVFSNVVNTLKTNPAYSTINTALQKPVEPITMQQLIEYGSSPANVTGYLMTNFPKDVMQITPNDRTQFQAVVAKLAGQSFGQGLPYLNAIQNVVKAGASLAQFRSLITPLSGASIAQSIQLNYNKLRETTFPNLPKIDVATSGSVGLPQAARSLEKNIGPAVIPGSMN